MLAGGGLAGIGWETGILRGIADETPETNLVFSYMNLARAFHELEAGAQLYCLHRNRWWQTKRGPALDAGAFVAGLEYAAQVHRRLGCPVLEVSELSIEEISHRIIQLVERRRAEGAAVGAP